MRYYQVRSKMEKSKNSNIKLLLRNTTVIDTAATRVALRMGVRTGEREGLQGGCWLHPTPCGTR